MKIRGFIRCCFNQPNYTFTSRGGGGDLSSERGSRKNERLLEPEVWKWLTHLCLTFEASAFVRTSQVKDDRQAAP